MVKTEQVKQLVAEEVLSYTKEVLADFEQGLINRDSYDELLFYMADIWGAPQIEGLKERVETTIGAILDAIREEIYERKTDKLIYLGSYIGVGNLAYSMRILNDKGWNLKEFVRYLDNKIDAYYHTHIDLYYRTVSPLFYDCIYGLSGMLNYYLEFRTEQKDIINGLLRYMSWLTTENENGIKRVFITELEDHQKKTLKVPYMDFGMSHGILGPMMVMAKAIEKGFDTKDTRDALADMYDLYISCGVFDEHGITIFPTQYAYEDYIQKNVVDYSFNNGWCYGNGSILFGLMKVADVLENESDYERFRLELLKLLQRPMEQYNLLEPVVCHGYASVIMLQLASAQFTGDNKFLETLEENILRTIEQHHLFQDQREYGSEYCFLEGADGVMMSILKAIGEEIQCSRLLFLE